MIQWFPQNISTYGGDVDHVFTLIYYIVGVWFIAAEGLLLYFVLRYRRRPGERAAYVRGETFSQLAWVLIPAAVVLALDLSIDGVSGPVWARIKEHQPDGGIEIHALARQFNWDFTYPGKDGKFGTPDDFEVGNELHVPVNQNVHMELRSKDVIHSFFIPTARLKQDILPGRMIKAWFNATVPGKYELPCAELCGFGHYTMRGWLVVQTPDEYQAWLAEQSAKAAAAS
ncbi:MAG: cytochrome c oxidase subunit II [Candidatus Binatia bacterium]